MSRSPRILATAIAGAAVAVAASLAVTDSGASTPGANGRIVFSEELSTGFQMFTIQPDGTGKAAFGAVPGDAVHADWSPDGTKVVFELDHPEEDAPPFCSVTMMNVDGSGVTDLTGMRTGCEGQPAFTPDGQRIVFGRFDDQTDVESIQSMDLSGGDRRLVTQQEGAGSTDPNVSPDGKWITFVRIREEGVRQALFAVHPDGSALHRLTPFKWAVAVKHDWSPSGKRIVLTTNADFARRKQSANLVTIRPDGSHVKRLTRFRGGEHARNAFAGSYAPDGSRIVFRLERRDKGALATIKPDGRGIRRITGFSESKPRFIDWGTAP
jgi:Tol biopolymer transport system component